MAIKTFARILFTAKFALSMMARSGYGVNSNRNNRMLGVLSGGNRGRGLVKRYPV
jgi:hypothetical protein